jgi:hypothetical protein
MKPATTIVVVPIAEGGIEVQINGERSGYFREPTYAAVAYAETLLAYRELHATIMEQVAWMHSRTPDQVNNLDAGILRAMATELRFKIGEPI